MYKELSSQKLIKDQVATLDFDQNTAVLSLSGVWSFATIDEPALLKKLSQLKEVKELAIEGAKVKNVDTCGMYFIDKIINYLQEAQIVVKSIKIANLNDKLFTLIQEKLHAAQQAKVEVVKAGLASVLGKGIVDFYQKILQFVGFFGQFFVHFLTLLKAPIYLKWSEVSRTINDAGAKGLFVSALLCFLIGVTLAYEMSPQFLQYGANVFIVNFLGIALLKEVAPLLTAVIVAGRTGASITAEIGTQKLKEEIDAIKTMGISPISRIVLPKVIGVMVALPLITALADIASMVGGAVVAKPMLGISYTLFLHRVQMYVAMSNYTCGIVKSFAFGLLIALVGCFCGFNVVGNANSIGQQTTKSVVLGIVAVVCCDAVFAIIFDVLKM